MRSPAVISSTNSMKQHRAIAQNRKPSMPQRTPSQLGHLTVWMIGISLAAVALWLLISSVHTQWQLGTLIGGSWLTTVVFDSYTLDRMMR